LINITNIVHNIGSIINTFVTNHPQKKTWSIQEIVSKYAGLSGKSISEFNEIFPNSKKMHPFQVREDREFEDIKPFIDNAIIILCRFF
jgi:hypothetical protein